MPNIDSQAISSHGTLYFLNGIQVAEVHDVTPPALTRKSFETSTQNSDYDSFVMGILRRGEISFDVAMTTTTSDPTASAFASGSLLKALVNKTLDLHKIQYPDGSYWLMSGYVSNFAPKAPVEGVLMAAFGVRPTNAMLFADGTP